MSYAPAKPRKFHSDIRYVDWAGSKGLLPLQKFKNPMKIEKYRGWLRKQPPPTNWTLGNGALEHGAIIRQIEEDQDTINNDEERDSNKAYAELKASQPLDPNTHLQPIYIDSHIVVVNKESGVLSVPGPRRNPSVGGLVHEYIGNEEDDVDSMVVHRLDMDTSGIICYARNKYVLGVLHEAFRNKSKNGVGSGEETVYKKYEALVCGHMLSVEGEIDLPLVRDQNRPPFMKVHIDLPSDQTQDFIIGNNISIDKHMGYIKMMSKAPKESLSLYRVLSWEYLHGLPVTRLELIPITGRTHQLRVHCAAIGYPIVGDCIYGYNGDGSPNGGLPDDIFSIFQSRATASIQQEIYELVQKKQNQPSIGEYNGNMCLHAKHLCFLHPITRAPMSFETDAPF